MCVCVCVLQKEREKSYTTLEAQLLVNSKGSTISQLYQRPSHPSGCTTAYLMSAIATTRCSFAGPLLVWCSMNDVPAAVCEALSYGCMRP